MHKMFHVSTVSLKNTLETSCGCFEVSLIINAAKCMINKRLYPELAEQPFLLKAALSQDNYSLAGDLAATPSVAVARY